MFDIGFTELAIIGVIALIVIGPEELPRVARTVGHLLGRLRRYVSDVKADISREMDMADLKRMQEEVEDSIRGMQNTLNEQKSELEAEFQRSIAPVQAAVDELAQSLPNTPTIATTPAQEIPALLSADAPVMTQHGSDDADPTQPEVVVDENQLDLFGAPKAPVTPNRSAPQ